jgi:hypothetical protein
MHKLSWDKKIKTLIINDYGVLDAEYHYPGLEIVFYYKGITFTIPNVQTVDRLSNNELKITYKYEKNSDSNSDIVRG